VDPARIFISYSRKDGAAFAADLRATLLAGNLSIWQDIVALEGGRDWWTQIEEALRSKALQHFVLVVTPGALGSRVVRREIRLARQEGKTVSPVKGPGIGDLGQLPRWLGQVYDIELPEHHATMMRVLQNQSWQKRVAMMAPEPPIDFIERPAVFEALKKQLLDAKGDAVAVTAALHGAGGYGKTALVEALAHDPDVQDAYFDGVLWVEFSERFAHLLPDARDSIVVTKISDLIEILLGERPGLESVTAAAAKLGEALGDRRILIIVDDAWRERDVRPFLHGGPNTSRLITTRIDGILPLGTVRESVDAMQDDQALALLAGGLPTDQVAAGRLAVTKLARRLGEWAQLLKMVNGFLRDRVIKNQQSLGQALADVNKRLDKKGLVAFDERNEADRTKAVARTVGVSLDLLDEGQRGRFAELGIFPQGGDIPIVVVGRLWAETSELDEIETEDLLTELNSLSLLRDFDLDSRTIRLHDTVSQFLRDQAGKEGLVAPHKQLLRALDEIGRSPDVDGELQRYFYLHLPYHLANAEERERLDKLLCDPGWLEAKLEVTCNPQALVADYEQHAAGELQKLIGRTLRLTVGICVRDKRQLVPQLLGRLMAYEDVAVKNFCDIARRHLIRPAILVQRPSLTPPGAESARLDGHSRGVNALCMLPDGRLASGSSDGTIRLWDIKTGAETNCLDEGHWDAHSALCVLPDGRLAWCSHDVAIRLREVKSGAETAYLEGQTDLIEPIETLCVLPDGRLASGSDDGTIWLWDVKLGIETGRLVGHSASVDALCALPDGRLASGSRDCTIRLWNLKTGAETARLDGRGSSVHALCVLPDGRLASGSGDCMIRLWDIKTGAETARLEGHRDLVNELCLLPDGRLASSGYFDCTIRLWDINTDAETACLKGHSAPIAALCMLPDGRLASGSEENAIRLWDVTTAADAAHIEGQPVSVSALCLLPDGRLASASEDNAIRLWNVTTGAEAARIEGQPGWVHTLCALPDGRLASGSNDGMIRLWDIKTGAEIACIKGHSSWVTTLCMLPDGRLASGAHDHTIRLWDINSGAEKTRLLGHSNSVEALCVLSDGRLASASGDRTIRLWDLTADGKTACIEGHAGWVTTLCVLPDGRLASGSHDHTIRLWDTTTGAETACIKGHWDEVCALCMLTDGRLASGSRDNTIRLWNVTTGIEKARIEIDAAVHYLVALPESHLIAVDALGRLHWLEVVD
jgi:WD40 repeat protein